MITVTANNSAELIQNLQDLSLLEWLGLEPNVHQTNLQTQVVKFKVLLNTGDHWEETHGDITVKLDVPKEVFKEFLLGYISPMCSKAQEIESL